MPITPENKHRYPDNWQEIRTEILERASNCCEFCGVENGAWGYRDEDGEFRRAEHGCCELDEMFRVVLTVAHLDHNPENNDPGNLKALCQRCHNRYDAPHRQRNAARTRRRKKRNFELFGEVH